MSIKKCKCGSREFYVQENYAYKSELDGDGNLDCGKANGGISEIYCVKCKKQYSSDEFNQINF